MRAGLATLDVYRDHFLIIAPSVSKCASGMILYALSSDRKLAHTGCWRVPFHLQATSQRTGRY